MGIPKRDHANQEATATVMQVRQAPGEAIDFVKGGGTLHITKHGRPVADLVPPDNFDWAALADLRKGTGY